MCMPLHCFRWCDFRFASDVAFGGVSAACGGNDMSASIFCGVAGNYNFFFPAAHVFTKFTSFVTEEHLGCTHNSLPSYNCSAFLSVRAYFIPILLYSSSHYLFILHKLETASNSDKCLTV